jgi:hypothetical protein
LKTNKIGKELSIMADKAAAFKESLQQQEN